MASEGNFYGVGVGPGDPELLTIKAVNAIKKADVIIAPKTEKKDGSVALTIAEPYISDAEIIFQTFPMVKNFEESKEIFEQNANQILENLRAGKDVTFLTLGDPMFFSTYIYVYRLLKNSGAKVTTIPGVPAFLAIASYLGRSAYGNDIVTIIPATAPKDRIIDALKISDAAVLMKVYKNFDEVVDMLDAEGMLENAVMISRYGLDDEKIFDNLGVHKSDKLNYLSTILTRRGKVEN